MAYTKTNLSQSEVTVEIDLEPLLGSRALDQDVRETFFQLALERLLERTASGRDIENKIFPAYSEQYKNSLAFAAFGKGNTPNLELTGDMLTSIQIIDQTPTKMVVGVSSDQAPKAYNHMVGDTVPKRAFLGWTDEELEDIAMEFVPQFGQQEDEPTISDSQILNLLGRLAREGLSFGEE
jgi:hypothetical protein